jgi:hypothetical protein
MHTRYYHFPPNNLILNGRMKLPIWFVGYGYRTLSSFLGRTRKLQKSAHVADRKVLEGVSLNSCCIHRSQDEKESIVVQGLKAGSGSESSPHHRLRSGPCKSQQMPAWAGDAEVEKHTAGQEKPLLESNVQP